MIKQIELRSAAAFELSKGQCLRAGNRDGLKSIRNCTKSFRVGFGNFDLDGPGNSGRDRAHDPACPIFFWSLPFKQVSTAAGLHVASNDQTKARVVFLLALPIDVEHHDRAGISDLAWRSR